MKKSKPITKPFSIKFSEENDSLDYTKGKRKFFSKESVRLRVETQWQLTQVAQQKKDLNLVSSFFIEKYEEVPE